MGTRCHGSRLATLGAVTISERRHLWLIGITAVGKTSTGRRLARALDVPFFDTDAEVSRRTHRSIEDLWREAGEAAFRAEERIAVRTAASQPSPTVIATGGGVVLAPESVELMRATGWVVLLTHDLDTLAARLAAMSGRPILGSDPAVALARLWSEREERYRSAADHVVDTTGRASTDVVSEIAVLWPRG